MEQHPTPLPVNNVPKWSALNKRNAKLDIRAAGDPTLQTDLNVGHINIGGANGMEKLTYLCWLFVKIRMDIL